MTYQRGHEYILVYVGTLDGTRGLIRMLEVTKDLALRGYDVGLWVLGEIATHHLRARVSAYISENGLDDRVRLFGYVDYQKMFSYLHAADVGLMLVDQDLYEYGLSNKMFEYMFAELPVVANATVSTRKYIPDECGELVDDGDKASQVEAVQRILDLSTAARAEMGWRGREYVEQECCWEHEEKVLLNLYESL